MGKRWKDQMRENGWMLREREVGKDGVNFAVLVFRIIFFGALIFCPKYCPNFNLWKVQHSSCIIYTTHMLTLTLRTNLHMVPLLQLKDPYHMI